MTTHTSRAPEPHGRFETGETNRSGLFLAGAGMVGAAVALSLGYYGRSHTPTGLTIDPLEPAQLIVVKSTLASVGAGLALFQLFSALWMWGKLNPLPPAPSWVGPAHRWSGTLAFLATLPVAYHCIWSVGFQDYSNRVLVHSVLGCAFYGALSAKLLILRIPKLSWWALPVAGGSLVITLFVIWLSSGFWYFSGLDLFGTIGAR